MKNLLPKNFFPQVSGVNNISKPFVSSLHQIKNRGGIFAPKNRSKMLAFIIGFLLVIFTPIFSVQASIFTDGYRFGTFNTKLFTFSLRPVDTFQSVSALSDLENSKTYQGLPVAEVRVEKTPNAWGTVILLPQYHRSPGSSAQDKINDAGVKSQSEIYQILNFLIEKFDVNLIMTEGHLYGPLSPTKIAQLSEKIAKRDKLAGYIEDLNQLFQKESLDPKQEEKLLKDLNTEIARIDREIILEGAAEKLAAEGKDIIVFGSENQTTQEESKFILRDYIFLSDRISQLNHSDGPKSESKLLNTSDKAKSILGSLLTKTHQIPFKPLEKQASKNGEKDMADLLKKTEETYYDLKENTPEKIMITASSDTPSREDNPYKDITDEVQLKSKLSEVKDQMEAVVIEKRNKETAQNFAKALHENNKNVGLLQFGAGHEKGMVEALQNQGLNVIVITSNVVSEKNLD